MRESLGGDPNPVTQFRPRRHGPEAMIQDIVAGQIPQLFCPSPHSWTAASVPLGGLTAFSGNNRTFGGDERCQYPGA